MTTKKKSPARKKAAKRLTVAQRAEALDNERRERFAMCYAANGGIGGRAYLEAGYECVESASWAAASRLLKDVKVQQRVKFWEREFHEQLFGEKSDVLRHVAEMAMFDPVNMFDAEGHLLPLRMMDRATRKSIQELKMAAGSDAALTEVKFGKDTRAYTEMLMKHYNAYADHQSQGANKDLKIYVMYPEDAQL